MEHVAPPAQATRHPPAEQSTSHVEPLAQEVLQCPPEQSTEHVPLPQ